MNRKENIHSRVVLGFTFSEGSQTVRAHTCALILIYTLTCKHMPIHIHTQVR